MGQVFLETKDFSKNVRVEKYESGYCIIRDEEEIYLGETLEKSTVLVDEKTLIDVRDILTKIFHYSEAEAFRLISRRKQGPYKIRFRNSITWMYSRITSEMEKKGYVWNTDLWGRKLPQDTIYLYFSTKEAYLDALKIFGHLKNGTAIKDE